MCHFCAVTRILGKYYTALNGCMVALLIATPSFARLHFDPSMLSPDTNNVADLSVFETTESQLPGTYDVDVVLNGKWITRQSVRFMTRDTTSLRDVVHLDDSGLYPCLSVHTLKDLGVNLRSNRLPVIPDSEECPNLEKILSQTHTSFNFPKMRLDISIPQVWLLTSPLGEVSSEQWDDGITAGSLDWNFTGNENHGAYGNSRNQFLLLKSGFNIGAWRFRKNGSWRNTESRFSRRKNWQNLSTFVQHSIIPLRSEFTIGDDNTPGDVFEAQPFRGVQLATDDSMYPDTARGFAPVIRGMAESNAQIDIRQRGISIYHTTVAAGDFEIDDLLPVNSGGDLDVSITEINGKVRHFFVPYSTLPTLQRQGHFRYSVTAGRYRNISDSYDNPAFLQNTLTWGVSSNATLYGGGQFSGDYRAFALGVGSNFGLFGAASIDFTQTRSIPPGNREETGGAMRFMYGRSMASTGTTFRLTGYHYTADGFRTFDEAALKRMKGWTHDEEGVDAAGRPLRNQWINYYNLYNNKKNSLQANISQPLGALGSLYVNASYKTFKGAVPASTNILTGFTSSIGKASYSLSYGYSHYSGQNRPDRDFYFSLSFPLTSLLPSSESTQTDSWVSYGASQDTDGYVTQQTSLSGTALQRHTLNWSVMQGAGRRDGNSGDASLGYKGSKGDVSVGYAYSRHYQQARYGTSGSAVLHSHGITFGQTLGGTNVLIAAPDAENIEVENGTGITTDSRGYALLPYATMYRENRISLNVNDMSSNIDIDKPVVRVVPSRGAIVTAHFRTHTGRKVLMTIRRDNRFLPFGSVVTDDNGLNPALTDEQGQVYLAGLKNIGSLKAVWGTRADQQCHIHYSLPSSTTHNIISRLSVTCI